MGSELSPWRIKGKSVGMASSEELEPAWTRIEQVSSHYNASLAVVAVFTG